MKNAPVKHLHVPLQDLLQYVCFSLVLESPELDTALHMCLARAKQKRRMASPDLLTMFFLMQPKRPLCGEGTLLAYVQLVHQDHQGLFCKAAFQPFGPQPILVHEVIPLQVQDFVFSFDGLHEIPVSPFLQPVEVPLDGSMTLWCISRSSQFCVISKLAHGALCPIIQIINEDVEQDWTQY